MARYDETDPRFPALPPSLMSDVAESELSPEELLTQDQEGYKKLEEREADPYLSERRKMLAQTNPPFNVEEVAGGTLSSTVPAIPQFQGPMPGYGGAGGIAGALRGMNLIPTPELEPMPRREVRPGFKAAMMDALRGMIPGYIQGQEAALKAEQLDVIARNKAQMDIFRERMDVLRPLITKDFEGEAAIQKFNTLYNYLSLRFPSMPENEKMAWAMGKKPSDARTPPHYELRPYILDDGSSYLMRWTEKGYVDQLGRVVTPQQLSRITQAGKPPEPQLVQGVMTPGQTEPGIGYVDPRTQKFTPVTGVQKYVDPTMRELLRTQRQNAVEIQREDLKNKQSTELTALQLQVANQANTRWQGTDAYKWYETAMNGIQRLRNLDTTNPANQMAVIYAVNKMWDPESVVREGERDAVIKFATTVYQKLKLDIMRVYNNIGFLPKEDLDKLILAAADQFKGHQQFFHAQRNDVVRRTGAQIKRPAGIWIADVGGALDGPDPKLGIKGRVQFWNEDTEEYDEFIVQADGTFMPIEK